MNLNESLKWRYATKKFDPNKKLSDEQVNELWEAIQLSASSYGLQPYKVLDIRDAELREKLKPMSWGQSQITDASHLFVFCANTDMTPDMVDEFVQRMADTRGVSLESISGYGDFVKKTIEPKSSEFLQAWNTRQVYIALGQLLVAAAAMGIDACPMEGFDASQYDEALGLKEQGLASVVVATVGFRSEEDQAQHLKKVRKPLADLFEVR
ncbi:NAD(P)H-dependent oxidoreductase [bacterium SCSIO 12741]|nr:NAD(P)H-dependent oxidoreductase [bacterium SCSIO 12741]